MKSTLLLLVLVSIWTRSHGMSFELKSNPDDALVLEFAKNEIADNSDGALALMNSDDEGSLEDDDVIDDVDDLGHAHHYYYYAEYYHVAFSAYLSSSKTLGYQQHIKFDKKMVDDNNNYNVQTGVFTAPLSGVYQLTVTIGVCRKHEVRANLMVEGVPVACAVAEGLISTHNVQGGNSVIVHMKHNQAAWVQVGKGSHVSGSASDRVTSFSGHLLYQRK